MSNRVFVVVASLLSIAVIGVAGISFYLGRMALNPLSIGLLAILIGVPGAYFLRALPLLLIGQTVPKELRARIARARTPAPRWAANMCLASLAAAYGLVGVAVLYFPNSPDSLVFGALLLIATGLFLFGELGLVYTSVWVQTHGMALAFAGIPIVAGGVWFLVSFVDAPLWGPAFLLIPVSILVGGVCLITAPAQILLARLWGLID